MLHARAQHFAQYAVLVMRHARAQYGATDRIKCTSRLEKIREVQRSTGRIEIGVTDGVVRNRTNDPFIKSTFTAHACSRRRTMKKRRGPIGEFRIDHGSQLLGVFIAVTVVQPRRCHPSLLFLFIERGGVSPFRD
jgi:hypothetical protein